MKLKLTLALVALLSSCINDKNDELASLPVGASLPSFSITMADGMVIGNKSLEGKVSVIVFFRTTCPDCQQELPVLQQIGEEFDNVKIVLVSVGEGEPSIANYWNHNGLSLPYSAQEDRTVAQMFGVTRVPQTYVCDRRSIVRFSHSDNPVVTYEQLKTELTELLK